MSEEYTFPPYPEKVQEAIQEFGGTVMEEYRGHDINTGNAFPSHVCYVFMNCH